MQASNVHYREFVYQKMAPVKFFIRKPFGFKSVNLIPIVQNNLDFPKTIFTFNKLDYRKNYSPPTDSCMALFSGALVYDSAINRRTSEYFVEDIYSSYVGSGDYPDCSRAFPKAHK